MTLSEFKAWFEGFSEGIETAPTADQFAKIKAKVALIDGAPITFPIYVERYWPTIQPAYPHYPNYPWWGSNIAYAGGAAAEATFGQFSYAYIEPASKGDNQTVTFDSHAAMRELGRAEAMN